MKSTFASVAVALLSAVAANASRPGADYSTHIPRNFYPYATKQLLMSFKSGAVQVQPGEILGINGMFHLKCLLT